MRTYSSGEQTRERIINATGELAAEHGFSNVSTRAVAERASANIGSIHYHFGSKDGLFEAVVREAVAGCMEVTYPESLEQLGDRASPNELSALLRSIVAEEINNLFRSGRPSWHAKVLYQLLQRDDELYDIVHRELLGPEMKSMDLFFRLVNPALSDDEVFLHAILLKMPIFAHVDYMKAMHKWRQVDRYSEEYLKTMEDLLVRQTQCLLGLPEDRPVERAI